MWDRLSIRLKLFLVIAASSAAAVAIMFAGVAGTMRSGFTHYLVETEIAIFEPIADALAERYAPDDPTWSRQFSSQKDFNDFVVRVLPPPPIRGAPRGASPSAEPAGDGRAPPAPRGLAPSDAAAPGERGGPPGRPRDPMMVGGRLSVIGPDGTHLIGVPIGGRDHARRPIVAATGDGEETVGYLALAALPRPLSTDSAFLFTQLRTLTLSALAALVLAGVLAALFSRQIVRPVEALARAARTLSSGDYAVRLPADRSDELGALVADVDRLARTLEANERANRSWLSDTSHELKTPLAVLRAEIEAVQDGVRESSPEVLGEMHEAVMRLARLVEDVGTLATMREGQAPPDAATDLSVALREAVERHRRVLEDAGLTIGAEIAPGLTARIQAFRFAQVLDNLIENARRYTEAPGALRLRAWSEDGYAQITLDDTPPRPAEADIARLFERFFRPDAARSRAHGGSGLGLAICKAIVEARGGRIAAEVSPLGGLRVAIAMPLEASPNRASGRAPAGEPGEVEDVGADMPGLGPRAIPKGAS